MLFATGGCCGIGIAIGGGGGGGGGGGIIFAIPYFYMINSIITLAIYYL
jgi:hypothetical protein